MDKLFAALLQAAVSLTGYDDPGVLPPIDAVYQVRLTAMMCPNATADCPVPTAVYFKGTVFYDKKLNLHDENDRSIVVHEMVHYLQDMNRWTQTDCANRIKRESEAYRVQYRYLLERGINRPAVKYGGDHVVCTPANPEDRWAGSVFIPAHECTKDEMVDDRFVCSNSRDAR